MNSLIAALLFLAGSSTGEPAASAPDALVADDSSGADQFAIRQQEALSARGEAEGWRSTPSGLRWKRVKGDGNGVRPLPADRVTAHYSGRLADGTPFDSSYDRNEPLTFPINKVIPAWQEALLLMGVGDTLEIAAPASLAYGAKDAGPIPGGSTLLFTIELLAIEPAQKEPAK